MLPSRPRLRPRLRQRELSFHRPPSIHLPPHKTHVCLSPGKADPCSLHAVCGPLPTRFFWLGGLTGPRRRRKSAGTGDWGAQRRQTRPCHAEARAGLGGSVRGEGAEACVALSLLPVQRGASATAAVCAEGETERCAGLGF